MQEDENKSVELRFGETERRQDFRDFSMIYKLASTSSYQFTSSSIYGLHLPIKPSNQSNWTCYPAHVRNTSLPLCIQSSTPHIPGVDAGLPFRGRPAWDVGKRDGVGPRYGHLRPRQLGLLCKACGSLMCLV